MLNGTDPQVERLGSELLNTSGTVPLGHRFRSLFELKSLAAEGHNSAIDVIAQAFSDKSALLKHELAYVLGQTQNQYAAPLLVSVLKDESQVPIVRHEAAEALGALGNPKSLPLLRHYLVNDKEEVVRQTCELAIARIEWEQSEECKHEKIQKSLFTSIDPAPALPTDVKSDVKSLQKTLNNQSLPLFYRYRAMFGLRNIGTTAAIDALASGFNDPSALFRHEIAYVFGQLSHPHSIPALFQVLQNSKEEGMVRHEAAEALGSIGTAQVLQRLEQLIHDPEPLVSESVMVALDMIEN